MGMLDGRVVIVTGGGRGIGREHCLELAGHGARVVVVDSGVTVNGVPTAEDPASEVVAEIRARGGEAVAEPTSVTDGDAVADLIARVVDRFGHLDAVVNNAGIQRHSEIVDLAPADWDALLAVHLTGTFHVVRQAGAHWRALAERGDAVTGRIVNTTSTAGLFGMPGNGAYGVAKAGVAALTIVTALELAPYGVTANAFSPIARTRMSDAYPRPEPDAGAWDRLDPGASSPLVAWLVSVESGWLTGAVFRVDANTVQRLAPWAIDRDVTYTAPTDGRIDAEALDTAFRKAYGVLPRGIPTLMGGVVPPMPRRR